MADLAPVAASVVITSGSAEYVTSGAAVTAGDVVYLDTADSNKAKAAECDSTELVATVHGIALASCPGADQPLPVLRKGIIALGTAPTEATVYVLSAAAGKIAPNADIITSTDYKSVIGIGNGTDLILDINNTGQQIP